LRAGPAVHLRGPSGPGAPAPGQAHVVGLEQSGLFQPVQMKLRLMPGKVERRSRRIAAHRRYLVAHVVVERFASAVGQRADSGHLLVELTHCTLPFYRTANLTLEIPGSNVKV